RRLPQGRREPEDSQDHQGVVVMEIKLFFWFLISLSFLAIITAKNKETLHTGKGRAVVHVLEDGGVGSHDWAGAGGGDGGKNYCARLLVVEEGKVGPVGEQDIR